MCLESFPLRCQRAIDQCSAFEECVEVLNERTLVVVPPETELLVVLHVLASFPRFCTDEKTNVDNERSVPTNVKPNNVRYADGVVLSLFLSRRFSLPCYRSTERPNAISSSRDRLLSRTSSRTTYPRKYVSRLSVPIRQSSSPTFRSRSLSLSLSPFSHAVLAGGRRKQKLRNEAPKLPKWPCERCVSRIALLAFSFVRVW